MRGRLGLVVGALVVGLFVAGCVVDPSSDQQAGGPTAERFRRPSDRRVTVRTAPAPPAASAQAAQPVAEGAATPSPFARYEGALGGPTYSVAYARGGSLPVAVTPGGPAASALSGRTRVGAPRVALVVGDTGDWLQVMLPLRPNGSTGWVHRSDVEVRTTSLRVEVDRAARRLQVFDAGTLVLDEPVAIGRAATPTPGGLFFTTELLQPPNPRGAYGPFAFTLSAYSTVYQRFGSGDGAIGIHGTNDPRSIGADVSHGCIRLRNDAVTRLAELLPLGTPVLIR